MIVRMSKIEIIGPRSPAHPFLAALLLALLLLILPPRAAAAERQKVLILNSYHQIYFWTDTIVQGVREVFDATGPPVDFYVENMDTKRFFDGPDGAYFTRLKEIYREKYANLRFDVIISSDDDALNFLVRNRAELFPGVPIVFCGVNNFSDGMLGGYPDITGVLETLDREETIAAALSLHPAARQIAVVTDTVTTGRSNRDQLKKMAESFLPARLLFLDPEGSGISRAELLARAGRLPRDTIIFYSDFHIDRDGRTFDDQRRMATEVAEASRLPVYTTYASVFGPGTVGGKLNNPLFQGRTAAEMAVRILRGEPVASIPIRRQAPNRFMFQYPRLQQFGLQAKKLPEGSIVVDRPVSFYNQHRMKIWIAALLFLSQSAIILLLFRDVRRRQRTAAELARWGHIFEHAQWGIAVGDPATETLIAMNPAFARMHGYTVAELLRKPVAGIYAPEARKALPDHIRRAAEAGHHTFESVHLRKDGSSFPVMMDVTVVREADGTVRYRVVNVQDISQRRQAADDLLRSETKFRNLFEQAGDGIFLIDADNRYLDVNAAGREMLGYSREELLRMTVADVLVPRERPRLRSEPQEMMAGKPHLAEWEHLRKNGSTFPAEVSARRLDDRTYLAIVRDLGERRKNEQALRESEERLRLATDLANVAVWEYDFVTGSMSRSPNHDRLYGLAWQEKWDLQTFLAATHPDDRDSSQAIIRAAVAAGGPDRYRFDFRVVHPDRSVHWLSVVGEVIGRDRNGVGTLVRGCLTDISDRKDMEQELQESQRYNRALFENSATGLALCRLDGSLVDVNGAFASIIGRTVAETLELSYWDITPETYRGQEEQQLADLKAAGLYGPYEKEYIKKDGSLVPVRLQGLLLEQGGEQYIWSSVEDISESKRSETLLKVELQILEMISGGAPGREVLAAIVGNIESLAAETMASILLLDADGRHIASVVAPSLPEAYNMALIGAAIGPRAGSCGTAAFHRKTVIVADIETDPLWDDYRDLARGHGLRACWSTPIMNAQGKVLGTFAMYYRQPRTPAEADLDLISRATHLAGIAIESARAEEALRTLNTKLEQRVKDRTRELVEKNAELERFNRLFVDRELAMIELKEKISTLENRCASTDGPHEHH